MELPNIDGQACDAPMHITMTSIQYQLSIVACTALCVASCLQKAGVVYLTG